MSWLGNEGLSALIGLALVLGLIYLLFSGWLRGVLMLGSAVLVVVSFGRHEDWGIRVLALLVAGLAIMIGVSIYFSWRGGSTSWWVRTYIFCLAATSIWSWIQRGAPWMLWVFPIAAPILIAWVSVIVLTPGVHRAKDVEVEAVSVDDLLERDAMFLKGLYDATNGRMDIYITPRQLQQLIGLASDHMQIAAGRLMNSGSIEWDDEVGGFVLKRRGIESVERMHREKKRAAPVGDTFHFHSNASGVFGSHNRVRDSKFQSSGVSAELLQAALFAADDLRGRVAPEIAEVVEVASHELRDAGTDESRLRRAAKRAAQIAQTVGEVGVPLLRAANEILKALPG
jgi:hypothetical protein